VSSTDMCCGGTGGKGLKEKLTFLREHSGRVQGPQKLIQGSSQAVGHECRLWSRRDTPNVFSNSKRDSLETCVSKVITSTFRRT
jgi:hypothetical protein